jgi:tripartite-type tricarboxylate transporter receptor subunit TctC
MIAFSLALFDALWTAIAFAQAYPLKTVRMIMPSASGTAPDIVGRIVSQKLSEGLGQTVIVENLPGAGGIIGTDAVARSAPDGYTLLMGTASFLSVSPALYSKVTYDSVNSFEPISMIGTTTYVMVVHPTVPARSVKELIALAQSRPGQLNYGASTSGTPSHLVMEMFKSAAGVDIVGVHYIGSAQALTSLLAGDVQVVIDTFASSLTQITSGKVRPLVVTSSRRAKQAPDVPSASEIDLPGFEADGWFGLLAPKGTPNDIVKRLHREVVKAISSRDLIEALERQGVDAAPSTPEEFLARLKTDAVRWATAVKVSGAKVQ